MKNLPKKIIELAQKIREASGRALLVGGCVRDALRGIEPKDFDLEIYGVEPKELRKILEKFGHVNAVGEAFTVYKLGNDLDVALPRRERKIARGHKGFVIEGDPFMSFEEACSRRDFTINAILQDPLTGETIDPFDGRADTEKKIIRIVSAETFAEDSLRVLRAAQFAARFEFDIEPQTVEICRSIDLTDLPRERIWGEMEKILLKAEKPSIGLKWLYDLGMVDQLFPEMNALVGADLLLEVLDGIQQGTVVELAQDERDATYARKFEKGDGRIDWRKPGFKIHNFVRALQPFPCAFTFINRVRVTIWKVQAVRGKTTQRAGCVSAVDKDSLKIACADGDVSIVELQPESKKRMTVQEYLNGAKVAVGDVLG